MPEYRLIQPHRINKVLQPVGYVVELPAQTGDWLIEQGVVEAVDAAISPPARVRTVAAPLVAPVFAPPAPRWGCCGRRPK